MLRKERLAGCIIGGAIGDAWGSAYENAPSKTDQNTFFLRKSKNQEPAWSLTDDTQLTLATLEALTSHDKLTPAKLADSFVLCYRKRNIRGIGASTLKALQELDGGGHWSLVGRTGEYAAGNGAAMRMAPFAFFEYTREDVRDFSRITHRNDEAYTGALAVFLAIRQILDGKWNGEENLLDLIIPQLPDTNVRDRLLELNKLEGMNIITEAAAFGTNGYVANSVPFAILCASQVSKIGLNEMFERIISCGGDTDTNASIAGHIAGALLGEKNIPPPLKRKLQSVSDYDWLIQTIENAKERLV